jgi:hypothetical protein
MGAFQFWGKGRRIGDKTDGDKPMKGKREEVKQELMSSAEEVIEGLLAWLEDHPKPTLGEIEEAVLGLRKELGRRMANAVMARQEERRAVPGPVCEKCGQEMQYKGEKRDVVESRLGPLKLERGYYYCARCKEKSFPPGPTTESERQTLE